MIRKGIEAAPHTNASNSFVKRLDIHLTSWSPWIDCTFLCGKMARQWRKRQAFKLTNCFGNSPYTYRLDVLVQIRSCNQRCCNGGTLQNIWCSCKEGFSGFCCEKGILLYVSAMLAALQVLKLCETNN